MVNKQQVMIKRAQITRLYIQITHENDQIKHL